MQYNINLDMFSITEWGLNIQQGVVFAYIVHASSWANRATDDAEYFNVSNGKLATELPSVSDQRDTMSRLIKKLIDAGVIEKRAIRKHQYLRITDKGKMWNKVRENYPASIGEREINPASIHRVRENDPASEAEEREENPASTEEREILPGATGNSSDESVIPTSLKKHTRGQPVDNSAGSEPEQEPAPVTLEARIAAVLEVVKARGCDPDRLNFPDSRLLVRTWLANKLTVGKLEAAMNDLMPDEIAAMKCTDPIRTLNHVLYPQLTGKQFDSAEESALKLRSTPKGANPDERNAALKAAGVKPREAATA